MQSVWTSLSSETLKLPWERGFWDRFLDPNTSVMDMLGKGFKRPLPAPVIQESGSASSREVERRVFPKPFQEVKGFLQHVRDIPERSWQEEREAMWETSVRRWVALTDTWLPESSTLIAALHNCKTFKEKAQIHGGCFLQQVTSDFDEASEQFAETLHCFARGWCQVSLR